MIVYEVGKLSNGCIWCFYVVYVLNGSPACTSGIKIGSERVDRSAPHRQFEEEES